MTYILIYKIFSNASVLNFCHVNKIYSSHLIWYMYLLPYRWVHMWPTSSSAYPSYEAFWWATSSLWAVWISLSDASKSFGSYALPYRGLSIQVSVFCGPAVILYVRHKHLESYFKHMDANIVWKIMWWVYFTVEARIPQAVEWLTVCYTTGVRFLVGTYKFFFALSSEGVCCCQRHFI